MSYIAIITEMHYDQFSQEELSSPFIDGLSVHTQKIDYPFINLNDAYSYWHDYISDNLNYYFAAEIGWTSVIMDKSEHPIIRISRLLNNKKIEIREWQLLTIKI